MADEQLQKAQRLTTEEDLENVGKEREEIEFEEAEQTRKYFKHIFIAIEIIKGKEKMITDLILREVKEIVEKEVEDELYFLINSNNFNIKFIRFCF